MSHAVNKYKKLISASGLHQVSLQVGSEQWREITLFPFFDRFGQISRYLLVRPRKGTVYLLDDTAVFKRWFGGLYLLSPLPASGYRAEDIEPYAPLYHYDPWWMLTIPPYDLLPRVADLVATNCPGLFTLEVTEVFYDRRIKTMSHLRTNRAPEPILFQPGHLSRRDSGNVAKTATGKGWRIRTTWPRWGIDKGRYQLGRQAIF